MGAVDSGESTSVTAYGDIVNLAARLQTEAAPGAVVMSERMFRQVEGMVEGELAGVFRFKGKSEPQPVYRLLALREGATRFDAAVARGLTSYIGRTRELADLEEQFKNRRKAASLLDGRANARQGSSLGSMRHDFRKAHSPQRHV
jgi:hypothetical protein